MKNFCIVCAAIALVAGMAFSASAADVSSVPSATLSSMGFGGADVMSDADGQAVRGKGIALVVLKGQSYATYGAGGQGADTNNSYHIVSSHYRGAGAAGGSDSYAGKVFTFGPGQASFQYVSGGASWGWAR